MDFDSVPATGPGRAGRPPGPPIEIKIRRIPGPVATYAVPAGTLVHEALLLAGILLDPDETVRTDAGEARLEDRLDEARSLFVLQGPQAGATA